MYTCNVRLSLNNTDSAFLEFSIPQRFRTAMRSPAFKSRANIHLMLLPCGASSQHRIPREGQTHERIQRQTESEAEAEAEARRLGLFRTVANLTLQMAAPLYSHTLASTKPRCMYIRTWNVSTTDPRRVVVSSNVRRRFTSQLRRVRGAPVLPLCVPMRCNSIGADVAACYVVRWPFLRRMHPHALQQG